MGQQVSTVDVSMISAKKSAERYERRASAANDVTKMLLEKYPDVANVDTLNKVRRALGVAGRN